MKKLAIGIDIGGTNSVFGVVNAEGEVLVKGNISTPDHGDVDRYVNDLSASISEMIDSVKKMNPEAEIMGIGVGAPNANYYSGNIEHAPNLSFKGVVPLVELLKRKFDLPAIALTNDANAAAIGEMVYGGAKDMKNFVMITLGTGLGSGIVVNGDLVYGHDGFAGEIGHTMLEPENGRICGCGIPGHLEAYCSAPGIKRTVFELLAKYNGGDSELTKFTFGNLESKDVYDAAMRGDKVALEAFEITGKYLGRALADTVHHLSPEAIFLFGGPTAAGDLIFDSTKKTMEQFLLPIFQNKVRILPSELKSGSAAIVGASALVWKELDK